MIQCKDCELCVDGQLTCNPAENLKETACLLKWQLIRLNDIDRRLEESQALSDSMMPRLEKLLEHQERNAASDEDGESWKHGGGDEEGQPG